MTSRIASTPAKEAATFNGAGASRGRPAGVLGAGSVTAVEPTVRAVETAPDVSPMDGKVGPCDQSDLRQGLPASGSLATIVHVTALRVCQPPAPTNNLTGAVNAAPDLCASTLGCKGGA